MLSWSNTAYKFTLGIGSLAITGTISELWRDHVPLWLAVAAAIAPLAAFVFVHPDELPDRIVRFAHLAASLWYLAVVCIVMAGLTLTEKRLSPGSGIVPLFAAIGSLPCLVVLHRVFEGRYPPRKEPDPPPPTPEAIRERLRQDLLSNMGRSDEAAKALAEMGDRSAIPYLLEAIRYDMCWETISDAKVKALTQLADASLAPTAIAWLEPLDEEEYEERNGDTQDDYWRTQTLVRRILVGLGNAVVPEVKRALLAADNRFARETLEEVLRELADR